jgi:adenylate cyclase
MLGRLRLYSGLVLFVYVTLHLANHALGVISVEAMDAGLPFTVAPWRTLPGTVLLAGAALVHVGVVLASLYRRRTLLMARWQAAQTWLGLLIPICLMGHAIATRGLAEVFAVDGNYHTELIALWLLSLEFGVLQAVLVVIAWVHACIGLHAWLRLEPWCAARQQYFYALAVLWPALALAEYVAGGMQVMRSAAQAGWVEQVAERAGMTMSMLDWVQYWMGIGVLAYLLLLGALFGLRALRERLAIGAGCSLRYDDRLTVPVRPGMTVLEALRAARVRHASVCGGRGRCSTCRVHIDAGA